MPFTFKMLIFYFNRPHLKRVWWLMPNSVRKCWCKAKVRHMSTELWRIIMSCNKEGNFELQTSLWGDFTQGEPAMDVDVPWHCNYSPISNKRKQIGGHSLVDEVNHVNVVVSSFILLCCACLICSSVEEISTQNGPPKMN